jgi:hypothetical protein
MIQLTNQILELNRLTHSIQKLYSRLKTLLGGYELSLIFDFFKLEDDGVVLQGLALVCRSPFICRA